MKNFENVNLLNNNLGIGKTKSKIWFVGVEPSFDYNYFSNNGTKDIDIQEVIENDCDRITQNYPKLNTGEFFFTELSRLFEEKYETLPYWRNVAYMTSGEYQKKVFDYINNNVLLLEIYSLPCNGVRAFEKLYGKNRDDFYNFKEFQERLDKLADLLLNAKEKKIVFTGRKHLNIFFGNYDFSNFEEIEKNIWYNKKNDTHIIVSSTHPSLYFSKAKADRVSNFIKNS